MQLGLKSFIFFNYYVCKVRLKLAQLQLFSPVVLLLLPQLILTVLCRSLYPFNSFCLVSSHMLLDLLGIDSLFPSQRLLGFLILLSLSLFKLLCLLNVERCHLLDCLQVLARLLAKLMALQFLLLKVLVPFINFLYLVFREFLSELLKLFLFNFRSRFYFFQSLNLALTHLLLPLALLKSQPADHLLHRVVGSWRLGTLVKAATTSVRTSIFAARS